MTTLQGGDVVNDVHSALLESEISHLNQLVSDLTREEGEVREQLEWMESRGRKRKRQVEFVGECFESNVENMWRLLKDEQVFIIGIHGMGGVGKTFLATYMENEIKRKSTFKDVFWITVSHHFTIFKLQHDIAEKIGVKLNRNDETTRATILSMALETREKVVLILDDVWKYIDLQKVGIPLRVNGIKLIITTRLQHVCRQMDVLLGNTITMHPFDLDEDAIMELFLLKLGHCGALATLPIGVQDIARSVAMKCDGLPLGISVVARTMKGINDIHSWRHALNQPNILEMGEEMKEEVSAVLERSFGNLTEKEMQQCFLHCAMLPKTREEELVMTLAESGLLNGKRSLEETFNEGHVIVDKLIDHSLLSSGFTDIYMHGLVRKMACHILNYERQNKVMVKCYEKLRKIPHVKEWSIDVEAVSLVGNSIKEIPEGISPNCPRLSRLFLSENSITHIPECFFTNMNALTLLDLSENSSLTCLPNSLSNLRSLVSLVLRRCLNLEYIPPLGELQALSKLDISHCPSILKVPQGLENLTNLRWLDMFRCENSTFIQLPESLLAGLTNMQYLDLRGCLAINIEDVRGMTMLECFAGIFVDSDNYNRYVREILNNGFGPQNYIIHVGKYRNPMLDQDNIYVEFKRQLRFFGDCDELPYLLPRDLAELSLTCNGKLTCLCAALSSNGSPSLENVDIIECTKLKSLSCSCCSSCINIQEHVIADLTQSLSLRVRGVFSHLKEILIIECHAIETLVKPDLVPQLGNLESITVSDCNSIKEIFAVSNNNGDDHGFNITLPKLTKLNLWFLPELKTVCKGILVCRSKYILDISNCPNIEEHHRIRRV